MNTFSKTIAALGIIATAWISTASADNYRLIDDLALSIARKSRLVVSETEYFRNCLLYTSPSPRDLSTSRMPSSA